MILVDMDDIAAHAAGDLAELALLVGRGLVQGRDTEVENSAFHLKASPVSLPESVPQPYPKTALISYGRCDVNNGPFHWCFEATFREGLFVHRRSTYLPSQDGLGFERGTYEPRSRFDSREGQFYLLPARVVASACPAGG